MATTESLKFGLWYAFRNPAAWRLNYAALYASHLRHKKRGQCRNGEA